MDSIPIVKESKLWFLLIIKKSTTAKIVKAAQMITVTV